MMKGVQYLTDMKGQPVAVQIDLRKYGSLWQEFCDVIVAETRRLEPHDSWENAKKRLAKRKLKTKK